MNGFESYEGLVEGFEPEDRPPHHERFDEALQRAVDQIPDGPPGWFKVETFVYVKHSSPGWIDGYRVKLSGGSS